MGNKSKAIGTRAESNVVKFGESYGYKLRRKALAGSKDEGDIEFYYAPRLYEPITIEVKAGEQTANPSRSQLEDWLKQARVEAENSGQLCVLCIVRYRRKLKDADVYIQGPDEYGSDDDIIREHKYLDEFFEGYR